MNLVRSLSSSVPFSRARLSSSVVGDAWGRWSESAPTQRLLRLGVLLLPLAALWCTAGSGTRPWSWLSVVLLGLSVVWAVVPDSVVGIVVSLVVLVWWLIADPRLDDAGPVVGATSLLLAHLCAALASSGPARVGPPGTVLGRWAGRASALVGVVVGTWGAALALVGAPESSTLWGLGLSAVVLVVGGLSLTLRAEAEG
ncbi:hypothetical protein [Nocardioides bruguierae]|uniref:Uncharacterized protein n=1 Tax=Nocardioides bruguierae TaxID=2945102 RepID=A0A9X2D4V7_9ACTN|nr:hypothetical protein [Nocardioides bruguierae]MCM0619054.1 hypothetical protein [Nocardioides bruguierae]